MGDDLPSEKSRLSMPAKSPPGTESFGLHLLGQYLQVNVQSHPQRSTIPRNSNKGRNVGSVTLGYHSVTGKDLEKKKNKVCSTVHLLKA